MYFFSVIGEIQVEEENDLHLIKSSWTLLSQPWKQWRQGGDTEVMQWSYCAITQA